MDLFALIALAVGAGIVFVVLIIVLILFRLWYQVPRADEVKIRTTAVYTGTSIMTTLSGARAAALGIAALKRQGYGVKTVQEYH